MIEIVDDVRVTHADLSPAALDFLDYVADDPKLRARPLPLPDLPPLAGPRILEINSGGGTLGGWTMRFWGRALSHDAGARPLLRRARPRALRPRSLGGVLPARRRGRREGPDPPPGELNLALVAPEADAVCLVNGLPQLNASYRAVLAEQRNPSVDRRS